GHHRRAGAEDLAGMRRIPGEGGDGPGGDPVVEAAVRGLVGEMLLEPRGELRGGILIAREREEGGAVPQPDLRVALAGPEGPYRPDAPRERLAVGFERGPEEVLQAVQRRVGGGVRRLPAVAGIHGPPGRRRLG